MEQIKKKRHSKYIIIGGGITGVAIAKELAAKGKQITLLEAKKIASQTSSASSKMLHGGIRYLEHLDFKLIYEALAEKNYWLKDKPMLVSEAAFFLPIYKESKWPLWFIKLGLFFYNLLSLFRNKTYPHLSKKKFIKKFPQLKTKGLRGAAIYSDAIVDDKKLCQEISSEAINLGANIIEEYQVISIKKNANEYSLDIHNITSNSKGKFTCKHLIIAAGPFTDQVVKLIDPTWNDIILPSKGVHLWIKKEALDIDANIVLQTKDNRIIFIINHKDRILVGTTETILKSCEVKFNIEPTPEEIHYILKNVNEYLKDDQISTNDIISSFAGIRPLVKKTGMNSSQTSRTHKIYTPQKNLYIIAGGKYTTFRVMAKDMIKVISAKS